MSPLELERLKLSIEDDPIAARLERFGRKFSRLSQIGRGLDRQFTGRNWPTDRTKPYYDKASSLLDDSFTIFTAAHRLMQAAPDPFKSAGFEVQFQVSQWTEEALNWIADPKKVFIDTNGDEVPILTQTPAPKAWVVAWLLRLPPITMRASFFADVVYDNVISSLISSRRQAARSVNVAADHAIDKAPVVPTDTNPVWLAILMKQKDPSLSDRMIAKKLNIHPSRLSRSLIYRSARTAIIAGAGRAVRRGFHLSDGSIEAQAD